MVMKTSNIKKQTSDKLQTPNSGRACTVLGCFLSSVSVGAKPALARWVRLMSGAWCFFDV
jgi:hypothetical protein